MIRSSILIVDDDPGHRFVLETLLGRWDLAVTSAEDGAAAVHAVKERPYDAVLMDIRMRGMDGLTALKAIKLHNPAVPVVIMTAFSAVDSAVDALKSGACDYLVKPLDFDVLRLTLEQAMEHSSLKSKTHKLHQHCARQGASESGIVGSSTLIQDLHDMITTVAPSEANVLITGKSGTGKELVARALHQGSARHSGPLVTINCAALSENLLESELFGHERGAFTGADRRRNGCFMQAHGGTLFLDEIGEMPLSMQALLLRAIQQREIQRVGSDEALTVDVRLLTATNRDLRTEVAAKRFREDLFYRLNVVRLHLPELRERREDIPLLTQHFLLLYAQRNRKDVRGFTPQAMDALLRYDWPGNVRELENTIERAVVLLFGSHVSEKELPASVLRGGVTGPLPTNDLAYKSCASTTGKLEALEKDAILRALRVAGNNKSEAARQLGISRKTLHLKLKNYPTT